MTHRITRLRTVAGAFVAALIVGAGAGAPAADAYTVQSITPWMQNSYPVAWSANPDRIYYNSAGSNGLWNGYSANPDGSGVQCLTCSVPSFPTAGTATNRGISDVSPNGQYMLVTVERQHAGVGMMNTQPGKGAANDVYLYTTDGQHAWPLTNIYQPGSIVLGSIWPRFDRTGNELVWDSMTSLAGGNTAAAWPLGVWKMQVANIVWSGGVPSLANVRTLNPTPGSFYEPYGFTPDDQHVLFATSNAGSWLYDTIDTIGLDGSGQTQLSPSAPSGVGNYSEFAFYTPNNDAIIWGRSYQTPTGMDYWIMDPNGANPQRLTYFNQSWSTEYLGYTEVGALAFNPLNPNQFVAAASADVNTQHVNADMITLNSSPTAGMMAEQFYADPNLGQLVSTSTYDLADGYQQAGSPAPGVPATNYSIRFSGAVTAPRGGIYSFCLAVEFNAQLYVNGSELVNAKWDYGKRVCGAISLTAGQTVPVVVDYEHGTNMATAQLSWIPPGATAADVIPSNVIAPMTSGAAATAGQTAASSGGSSGQSPSAAGTGIATGAGTGTGTGTGTGAAGASTTTARTTRAERRRRRLAKARHRKRERARAARAAHAPHAGQRPRGSKRA